MWDIAYAQSAPGMTGPGPLVTILPFILIFIIMYFLIITPVAMVVRLFYDPMARTFDRRASSYWLLRTASPPSRYFRQF